MRVRTSLLCGEVIQEKSELIVNTPRELFKTDRSRDRDGDGSDGC